ncbi:hypothetical protein DPMN_008830 [Dreissena polymorpha]|uniref:Uncharacterized protein n=1 Tax=Dreissena polymorpha TaxID=45954 RepID=A0A9D4MZ70_DREPO|nr:hypothetical protein DPMN_008830 [Dreissena polymorpha]
MFLKQPAPIFELVQDIIGTNLQTKFHDDWKINESSQVLTRKNALLPGGHVFQPTGIIFQLVQYIIGMNRLTKVFTRKNALPLGSHVFQANTNIFDWTIKCGLESLERKSRKVRTHTLGCKINVDCRFPFGFK